MLQLISEIVLTVLAPILILVAVGAVMRWKLRLDVSTLSKLNIYLFVPGFVFQNVSTSTLRLGDMAGVFGITVLQVATLGLLVWGIGRALKVSRTTLAAVALAVMFYNSGNYGIPLAELAFPKHATPAGREHAASYQTFVLMAMNLLTFTVGMAIAAAAHHGSIWKGMAHLLRLPILPALAAGMLGQWWVRSGHEIPLAISVPARYLKEGLVPIALVTLGAQLATNPRWPRWRPVGFVLVVRLIVGPLLMMGLLWALSNTGVGSLNVWPWPAEMLILTASVPTAVNTLLLTLEIGGDAELAADCVFWTTVFSCGTITLWMIFLRTVAWQ